MIDRTTKLLLAAIAIGLFLNAGLPVFQPTVVVAEEIETRLRQQRPQNATALRNVQGVLRERQFPPTETSTDRWLSFIYAETVNQTNILARRLPQ